MPPEAAPAELVSVIIPAYDEEAAVGGVLDEMKEALPLLGCDWEVVVVDDGSRDGTARVVAERPWARLLRNPINLGYGHSLLRGILAARGNLVALCDADATYAPRSLRELHEQVRRGADHAIGRRTGRHLPSHLLLRYIYRWLCGYVVGRAVPDANSGLRLFRREVVEALRDDLSLGFSFTTSLTLASMLSGYVVVFVPIPYAARSGRSHVKLRDALRTAQYLFQIVALYNPVKLFLPLIGLASLAAGCGMLLGALGGHPEAWLPAAGLGAVALLLMGMAAHAHILSRTVVRRRVSPAPADAADTR
jgi:glycosyltransferase involved in cell wall biosynthesis